MATSVSHLNFIYKLEGDVTEVDIFKLAPTLLALGELIQDSNLEINPNGKKISVNVKPFRTGSFVVDMRLFAESNFQQLIEFFTPHSLEQLKTLLEIIGLTGGLPYGAIKAIKHVKGKPKNVEEVKPGEFRYTSIEDESITVTGDVHRLLINPKITNNIYKIYVTPLEELPKVDDIKTYVEGDESGEVVVTKSEVPALKEFVNPAPLPVNTEEITKETLHKSVYLNPKRGAFDGDPRDWSFWRGEDVITATIKDKDFLERCIKGEYRLNYSDLLMVDLLEKQKVIGTKVYKPIYEIIKVTNYIAGAQQQPLDMS